MKRTVISILIFLGTINLGAQNNVVVTVSKSQINYETYITTTITNKNAEVIVIPAWGIPDDYGNVDGGPSYIRLNAYNDSYLTASSEDILICQDYRNAPLLKILPNQSYKKTERLYYSNSYLGYFHNPLGSSLKYFEAKVHLVYIYFCDSNPTTFTADFISAKVVY